ncbi:MAG TPA: CRISPR-associated endonuclease Cas1 [Chloroflexia bacterium]|nr:CRISPR-associated endonuclease Cas1 [Chloroflexia bacterium]
MVKKSAVEPVAVDMMLDEETQMVLKNPAELIVDEWGAYIGKHSERLRVSRKGETLQEVPLVELKQVLITSGGVSLSSDVVEECARRGIAIHFLDFGGRAYASLFSSQLSGTVKTRREQLLAYTDRRGLILGKTFAAGKIRNQVNTLRYLNKNRAQKMPELYAEVRQAAIDLEGMADELARLEGPNIEEVRGQLLAQEGQAAKLYWEQFKKLLLADYEWPGREGQGATDLINSLLNYGYGVLYSRVEQALVLAGLDPFAGFVHTDRPGKPSLVFDLVEEFRQPVVDRVVVSLLNLKTELVQDEQGRLTAETRKLLARKIMERLNESRERYEKKRQTLQYILYSQARHIATYVRGDLGQDYQPFICGW